MKKGKSRMRARTDIMRANISNARRKQRQEAKAKAYDQHKYDGSDPDASE
jgi:hypothetical protein